MGTFSVYAQVTLMGSARMERLVPRAVQQGHSLVMICCGYSPLLSLVHTSKSSLVPHSLSFATRDIFWSRLNNFPRALSSSTRSHETSLLKQCSSGDLYPAHLDATSTSGLATCCTMPNMTPWLWLVRQISWTLHWCWPLYESLGGKWGY